MILKVYIICILNANADVNFRVDYYNLSYVVFVVKQCLMPAWEYLHTLNFIVMHFATDVFLNAQLAYNIYVVR